MLLQLSLLLAAASVGADAKACSPGQLTALFQEAMGAVNVCKSASEVAFGLPPTRDLSVPERRTLCVEPKCKEMMGVIDDLAVPSCDVVFLGRNLTLQATLDRFVSACDGPSVAPSARKRATPSPEASSRDDSAAQRPGSTLALAVAAVSMGLTLLLP
ncbi:hypothetical protein ATCC90586_004812 [Pythium insidiosum]|nr:hypothetical protein ATCC90586_004812 [Pythium insidiosum]